MHGGIFHLQIPRLQLKSSEGLRGEAGGNAVLCTPDKTFNIRQKNSSNTVYILQPGQDGSVTDELTAPGLIGVSKIDSTLETLPVPKSTAATHIRQLLPVLTTTGQVTGTQQTLTKSELFSNIPFSDAECEAAYRELSIFEDDATGHCIVPSAQLKIQMWLSILESSRANAIDLTTNISNDALQGLQDGLDDLQPGLWEAVIKAFTTVIIADKHASPDSDRLVRWVGLNRLESDATKNPINVSTFKASWKDALPEKLRDRVDLALLSDRHQLSAGGKSIVFTDYALDLAAGVDGIGASESKSALGTKRKWHDKFKPAKKTA